MTFAFWIGSIVATICTNYIGNKKYKSRVLKMGYIKRVKKPSKTKLVVHGALNFVPYLNLIISAINIVVPFVLNDTTFEKFVRSASNDMTSFKMASFEYEKIQESIATIADAMILEGADQEIIEIEKKKLQKPQEVGEFYPIKKSEYKNAAAGSLAEDIVREICMDIGVSGNQKKELLTNFRKSILDEKCKKGPITADKIMKKLKA